MTRTLPHVAPVFSLASIFSLALFTTTLAACSSPDTKRPVIDDLDLPDAVSADPDGAFTLKGTISFHDDSEPVSLLKLRIPSSGQTLSLGLQASTKGERLPITIRLAGAPQTLAYEVSIVSTSGVESASLQQDVSLR